VGLILQGKIAERFYFYLWRFEGVNIEKKKREVPLLVKQRHRENVCKCHGDEVQFICSFYDN